MLFGTLAGLAGKSGHFNFDATGLSRIHSYKILIKTKHDMGLVRLLKKFEIFLSMGNTFFLGSEVSFDILQPTLYKLKALRAGGFRNYNGSGLAA